MWLGVACGEVMWLAVAFRALSISQKLILCETSSKNDSLR